MKQVKIKNDLFNKAIKTIKKTIAIDNSRPILKTCKCEVDEQYIRFISLDGFAATILEFEHLQENIDKFDFLFVPFTVSDDKQGQMELTIEKFDNYVSFKWLDENLNEIEKKVKPFDGAFVNIDEIYTKNRTNDSITIGFDARLLVKVLKGNGIVKITFDRNNNKNPIFITNFKDDFCKVETLVLPVRLDI